MTILRPRDKRLVGAWPIVSSIGPAFLLIAFQLLAAECMVADGWAQSTATIVASSLRGEVTGVNNNQVIIDNKSYQLISNIVITDERQQRRELKDLSIGEQVAFHLTNGVIDRLVVILPR
jgi:hypothetical protein